VDFGGAGSHLNKRLSITRAFLSGYSSSPWARKPDASSAQLGAGRSMTAS
jgi:hypothetical protein